MENVNEDIIIRFMHEQKEELEDNGFSRRVMRRLPRQHRWAGWIFNAICMGICLYLFYLLNGMEILFNTLKEYFLSFSQSFIENANLTTMAIAVGVIAIIGVSRACTLED